MPRFARTGERDTGNAIERSKVGETVPGRKAVSRSMTGERRDTGKTPDERERVGLRNCFRPGA
jgi:hypothetical protein